jgi:hypothetical protein
LCPELDTFAMQSEATWWFVSTRPVDDTNEPEPPAEMRTEESRT